MLVCLDCPSAVRHAAPENVDLASSVNAAHNDRCWACLTVGSFASGMGWLVDRLRAMISPFKSAPDLAGNGGKVPTNFDHNSQVALFIIPRNSRMPLLSQ